MITHERREVNVCSACGKVAVRTLFSMGIDERNLMGMFSTCDPCLKDLWLAVNSATADAFKDKLKDVGVR